MPRKVTVKGLARAIEERLDSQALLYDEAHRSSVTPSTITRAERAEKKLNQMLKDVNMEAKDGLARRYSPKKGR
jgi:hypothetical protein